jgi:hypothetical protein
MSPANDTTSFAELPTAISACPKGAEARDKTVLPLLRVDPRFPAILPRVAFLKNELFLKKCSAKKLDVLSNSEFLGPFTKRAFT